MPQRTYQKETAERLAKIEEQAKTIFQELREIKLKLQIANGRTRTLESKQALIFGLCWWRVICILILFI